MKKIISVLIIICGVFFVQAQPDRLDSIIAKFQDDNRSFEEFILLGRMECYSNVLRMSEKNIRKESPLYANMYGELYNSLTPLTRLLKRQSIMSNINDYFTSNKEKFELFNWSAFYREGRNNPRESPYYKKMSLCDYLFDKNNDYKKQYLQLINNKENYLISTDAIDSFSCEEIEAFRRDYLENYFIRILTE